jgi:hypothetical protein
VWWEDGFDPKADERFVPGVAAAIEAHRQFAGVRRVTLPRTARLRPIAAEIRERLAPASR